MFQRVLVANRGEIALRLVRALQELGVASVAVYAQDDAQAPHVAAADVAVPLQASGPAAYLDGAQLLRIAHAQGCDALHPGYGFLSENAAFALACAEAGVRFIGPTPAQLALLGDKARARALAQEPALLFMDEPTASLDFGNQLRVLEHLLQLRERGIAILMSTHQPEHALRCADRTALVGEGSLIAVGATANVATVENLARLYRVPENAIAASLPLR